MMASGEKPPIRAVIFDLDGLLIDSEPVWARAYLEFSERHNTPKDYKFPKNRVGMGLREIVLLTKEELGFDGSVEDLVEELRGIFYEMLFKNGEKYIFNGAKELIGRLAGKVLAVATGGHSKKMSEEILKRLKINNYFQFIVSSDDVKCGKPAPDIYISLAKIMNIKPEKCLVLEDTVNGLLAAKAAGMRVYGVNESSIFREDLVNAGADEVFSDLSEVEI